jgi:hypothetical protein
MRPALLVALAFVAGAAGGVSATRLVGEARADASGGGIVVPVPAQGVVFRAPAGNAIARVRTEPAGGVVEVLDAREQVAVRLRASDHGGVVEVGAGPQRLVPALSIARTVPDPGY